MALVYIEGFPSLGFIGARKLTTTPPPPAPETPPPPKSPFNLGTSTSSALAAAVKEMTAAPPPPPPPPAPTSSISNIGARASAAVASAFREVTKPAPSFTESGAAFTAPASTAKPASLYSDTGASFAPAAASSPSSSSSSSSSSSGVAYGAGSSVAPDVGVWTSSGPSPGSHVAQTDAGSYSTPLRDAVRELVGDGSGQYAPLGAGLAAVPVPEKRIFGLTGKQLAIGAALVVAAYFFLGGKGGASI